MKKPLWSIPFVLWLAGCGSPREAKPTSQAPPVAVSVVTVAEQQWPSIYEATGTVRARTSAVIAAKLMGYVREVKVQAGDRVREGQLLVTLDARDLDVNSRRAEAALDEVRSSVPEADSAVAGAKANLDLAQTTFNRMQDLWNKKSISNQEFDEASAKLKAAQAAYEMARARRALNWTRRPLGFSRRFEPRRLPAAMPKSRRRLRASSPRNRLIRAPWPARRTAADHRARGRLPAGGVRRRVAPLGNSSGPAGFGDAGWSRPHARSAGLGNRTRGGRRVAFVHGQD